MFVFQLFKSYEDCSAYKTTLRPDKIDIVENDAISHIQETAEHTFRRTVLANKLHERLIELRDKNGGELAIVYYVNVGQDGSSGKDYYQLLDGAAILQCTSGGVTFDVFLYCDM